MSSRQSGGSYTGNGDNGDNGDSHGNNPNNKEHKGHTPGFSGDASKASLDNHGQQLNPNNPKFQEPKK